MGKNRKLKNGVLQVENYCPIETEHQNQEIPEDFLTSDDFCIVQKKKGKKFLDPRDFEANFQAQENLGKNEDENDCKSHTSFWTHKADGDSSDKSEVTEFGFQTSYGKQEDSSPENSDYYTEPEPALKQNFETLSNEEKLVPETGSSNFVAVENDNHGIESFNKNEVKEDACCTKKKNKKKEHKKKAEEEEVERLLKELELDEKTSFKHKNAQCATVASCKSSYQLSGKTFCSSKISEGSSISNAVNRKTSDIEMTRSACDKESSVSLPESNNSIDGISLTDSGKSETSTINEAAKRSEKRKAKRSKAKQKTFEIEKCEKSDLCDANSVQLLGRHETLQVENDIYSDKGEKVQKSQIDSDKRGKRPSKKQLAMIHEALKKAKEEEERLKREEEMKQKMAEEAERIRQEKLKQEQEKKEKKKLKEKQRREKMKAEGRLLSKSQKQSRARMEATLAAFRQQGVDVPQIGDKPLSHGPRLGSNKNYHRRRYDSCRSTQSCDSAIVILDRHKSQSFSSQELSGKDSSLDIPSSCESTEELASTPESDRGIFSYSDESDALDDSSCNSNMTIIDSKTQAKCKKSKTMLTVSQIKPTDSKNEVNDVKYRSPVVCVLGHVDTGKTKLLDYIRKTHVQDSEAGGITQQIGATMIPLDALKEKCKMIKDFSTFEMKIPGLLVIDTPGHETFSNLRSRGSSICDIAVLVVDIMHGLEPQTIESINLLKRGKTPFVVALNKVDRIYGWKGAKNDDIESTIKNQSHATQMEFKRRCQEIILQFANQCLNVALYYENKDPRSYISMIPSSAITGDGMGNVLSIIVQLSQCLMSRKLIYSKELEATVLEVKAIPGLGTTVDVILVNGRLQEGDTIVLAGQEGPIVTQIRSLLMPQPLKELRVKNPYIEYKAIEGAQGIKITGKDLEKTIAGLPLFVASNHNRIEDLKEEINHLFRDTINSIKTSERGVYVQASTLGSLEALLEFLSTSGIPYFNVKIGPVVKKDVMKASIMLEHDVIYAAILAFDVKIERDAMELADSLGVRIFHADIIYHLFDMYINFRDDLLSKQNEEIKRHAVFPCKLRILPDFIFNPRDPIVLGVHVEQGSLRVGTPLCIPSKDALEIGVVSSVEMNNNKINCAKKGDEVCIKIDPKPGEVPKAYGKHFSYEDLLVSRITRQSIDTCKEHFRNELQSCDWHLMVELKKMLHIV